jgi:hypothetical protein
MFSKKCTKFALTVLFFAGIAVSSSAQVAPSATGGGGWTFGAGAGVSYFHMDYNRGQEFGGTLWVDATRNDGLFFVKGLGVEMEARDISFDRGALLPNDMRTDTIGGGPIYSWRHFPRFRPYGKFLVSYGNVDITKNGYHYDWVLYSPGAGVEYRPFGRLWLRADYEYQIWPNSINGYTYTPDGVTVGAVYEFGHRHSSEYSGKPEITGIWPVKNADAGKPRITGISPVQN